jgi:hypothetical protein
VRGDDRFMLVDALSDALTQRLREAGIGKIDFSRLMC